MQKSKIRVIATNALVLVCAVIFTFPGILGKITKGGSNTASRASLTYSYTAPNYKVDVKDVKSEKDIKFIYGELDKSKVLGETYPVEMGNVNHEGSLFIIKRAGNTYQIISSICWYGEKSNVCLVQRESGNYQYIEMTPELQKFFNRKFTKKK